MTVLRSKPNPVFNLGFSLLAIQMLWVTCTTRRVVRVADHRAPHWQTATLCAAFVYNLKPNLYSSIVVVLSYEYEQKTLFPAPDPPAHSSLLTVLRCSLGRNRQMSSKAPWPTRMVCRCFSLHFVEGSPTADLDLSADVTSHSIHFNRNESQN